MKHQFRLCKLELRKEALAPYCSSQTWSALEQCMKPLRLYWSRNDQRISKGMYSSISDAHVHIPFWLAVLHRPCITGCLSAVVCFLWPFVSPPIPLRSIPSSRTDINLHDIHVPHGPELNSHHQIPAVLYPFPLEICRFPNNSPYSKFWTSQAHEATLAPWGTCALICACPIDSTFHLVYATFSDILLLYIHLAHQIVFFGFLLYLRKLSCFKCEDFMSYSSILILTLFPLRLLLWMSDRVSYLSLPDLVSWDIFLQSTFEVSAFCTLKRHCKLVLRVTRPPTAWIDGDPCLPVSDGCQQIVAFVSWTPNERSTSLIMDFKWDKWTYSWGDVIICVLLLRGWTLDV